MTRGLSPARLALIVFVALAVVAGATVSAFAYFASSGSAGASIRTGTLNPPTGVTATSTAGTGSVAASWTAPTGGVAPLGYYVTRSGAAACGSSASSLRTSTSCTDSSVPLGTYTYTVVAVFRSWTATSGSSAAVTVAQATQSIVFTSAPATATFGGSYTVTATGGASGQPVTFSSGSASVCTVSGSSVSFVGAGSCSINANQAGSTYYSAAPVATQTFTVAQASQTVTFTSTAPTNAVVGGSSYTVTASGGGSGAAVTFTSGTPAVCSVSGAVVSFQHVGSCVVNANQAGNTNYLAANQVQQSIAVGKGSQSISVTSTPPSAAKIGGSYTPAATSSVGLLVVVTLDGASTGCTLASGTVSFAAVGTCIIDFNQSGNADYNSAAQLQQSFTITKVDQTITNFVVPSSAVFNAGPGAVSASASSGLALTFSSTTTAVCTVSGTSVAYLAAGTCTIAADQTGNAQYNAAPQVLKSFAIAQATQTITFTTPAAGAVGGTGTFSVASDSGLSVAVTSATTPVCTVSGTTITYVTAGTCTLNANQGGNGNYSAAAQVQRSITVGGFAISSKSDAPPQNSTSISGVGGAAGQTITVRICTGTQASCTSGSATLTLTMTATVVSGGNWTAAANSNKLGTGTFTAQATQPTPSATSAVFVFTN